LRAVSAGEILEEVEVPGTFCGGHVFDTITRGEPRELVHPSGYVPTQDLAALDIYQDVVCLTSSPGQT
jgi:hypothetical protein